MLSKLMCGAILASAAAGAAAQTWSFTYTGLFPNYASPGSPLAYMPDTINGSFSGTDRNGDGVISANELTAFVIHSIAIDGTDFARCTEGATATNKCSLDAFSFGPQGNLAFSVNWSHTGGGDKDIGSYGGITSGASESVALYNPGGLYFNSWSWTPDTTLAISPPPVPEPSRAALALAGLLALGLARLPSTRRPRGRQT